MEVVAERPTTTSRSSPGTAAATTRSAMANSASASSERFGVTASEPASSSLTGHRDVGDNQRHATCAHRQPLEVAADLDDVEQHPLQRRYDGDLADGFGDGAAPDPQPLGAGREIATDGIDPRMQSGDALDEDTISDRSDQLGLAARARHQHERMRADA